MGKFIDITGQRFNRLVAIEYMGKRKWLCKCDCGNECFATSSDLTRNKVKSCGCLKKETAKENGKTHKSHTDEWKKQHSERMRKEGNPNYGKSGELSHMYGKHHSEETKRKIGDKHRNPNLTDEDRQDRRCDKEYIRWRDEVRELANYTCDCCSKRGGDQNAHHLSDFHTDKNQRYNVNNGVCLCVKCHREFHSHMGGYHVSCTADDYYKWKQLKQEENSDSNVA